MRDIAVIGIDPGITGAATLLTNGEAIVHDWESLPLAFEVLCEWKVFFDVRLAMIEDVHAISYVKTDMKTGKTKRFSQKGTSNFKFGENAGMWKGLLTGLALPYECVTPQAWQSGVIPKKKSKSDKPSFKVAKELYPNAPLEYVSKHHNRADSIMIARYAARKLNLL